MASEPKCPHCGKAILLVGAGELKEEFGIGPNTVQHAREKGTFPEPWLSFANRNVYLRGEVEKFNEDRRQARTSRDIESLAKRFEGASDEDIKSLISGLEKALSGSSR